MYCCTVRTTATAKNYCSNTEQNPALTWGCNVPDNKLGKV